MVVFAGSRKLPQYNYIVTNNLYVACLLSALGERRYRLLLPFPLSHLFLRWCFHHKSLSGFYSLLINEVAKQHIGIRTILAVEGDK